MVKASQIHALLLKLSILVELIEALHLGDTLYAKPSNYYMVAESLG
jgi:hypothetical protein